MSDANATTIDQPAAAPTLSSDRHLSMDVIRGVAVFGILLINITGMGYPVGAGEFAGTLPWSGANFWAWFIPETFFEGSQRGLFSLLFGAGVIILTSRAEARGAGIRVADIYYRRNLWLIAFGMVNSYILLWWGDILYFYGLAALFLFPLRNVRPRNLLITGAIGLVLLTLISASEWENAYSQHADYQAAVAAREAGETLSDEQQDAIESWQYKLDEAFPDDAALQERIETRTSGYAHASAWTAEKVVYGHTKIAYQFMLLDNISFMLIGMALFKWGILTLRAPAYTYWLMLLLGYGIGLPLRTASAAYLVDMDFDLLAFYDTTLIYDIKRPLLTAGHLGLLLLFVRSGALAWLQRALAAVGRMALTNYIMHSVFALLVFLPPGLALFGQLERYQLYIVVAFICALQLIASPLWLRWYRFGPLEWLWRSLTYRKKQPMRRLTA